jgi:hypothetical protein
VFAKIASSGGAIGETLHPSTDFLRNSLNLRRLVSGLTAACVNREVFAWLWN